MKKLVDKTIDPADAVAACAAAAMTWAQAQRAFNGVFVIGKHKGEATILDITTLVEPLVLAEQQHILGLLDGREEDYDLQTITIPKDAVADASVRERLTVPAGEVWFITAVELTTPADQGGTPTLNWRCSLWTDRAATPDPDGQAFRALGEEFSNSPGGGTGYDEFVPPANWWAARNKPVMLRLPAGTVITAVATNTGAKATANMDCTLRLYGFIGKSLVA